MLGGSRASRTRVRRRPAGCGRYRASTPAPPAPGKAPGGRSSPRPRPCPLCAHLRARLVEQGWRRQARSAAPGAGWARTRSRCPAGAGQGRRCPPVPPSPLPSLPPSLLPFVPLCLLPRGSAGSRERVRGCPVPGSSAPTGHSGQCPVYRCSSCWLSAPGMGPGAAAAAEILQPLCCQAHPQIPES